MSNKSYNVPTQENIWLTVPVANNRSQIPAELWLKLWKTHPAKTANGKKYPATYSFTSNGIICYIDKSVADKWELSVDPEGTPWIVVHPTMYSNPVMSGTTTMAEYNKAQKASK